MNSYPATGTNRERLDAYRQFANVIGWRSSSRRNH
jgi:hypothetical protein